GKNRGAAKSHRKPRPPQETGRVWLWAALGGAAVFLVLGGGVAFWLTRPKKVTAPTPPEPVAAAPQVQPVSPPTPPEKEPPPQDKAPPPPPPAKPPAPPPPPPAPLSRPAAAKPAPK